MHAITRENLIRKIEILPSQIEALVHGLMPAQLTTHYLAHEWTVAQNVHHLFDSHANSYVRCKLIMTEENPPLKAYDQDKWAFLADASQADIANSLALLAALHQRWVIFWSNLAEPDFARTGLHSQNGLVRLDQLLAVYADHGEAHIDQITRTLAASGSA